MNNTITTHIYKTGDTVKITQQGVLETGCIGTLIAPIGEPTAEPYWRIDGLSGFYTARQFELINTTQQPTKPTKTITRADIIEMVVLGMRTFDSSPESRLTRATNIVNDYLNNTSSEPWWVAEVKMCHKNGLKLAGVKTLINATGLGLKEAKDAYEFYDKNGFFNINADGTIII